MAASAASDAGERLFFGLPLTDAARTALQAATKQAALPPTARLSLPQNYHMTLVFLGQTGTRQLACIRHAADAVQVPEFTLQLDHLGHWPRPQVLWAAPSAPPDALGQLVTGLQQRLCACGFEPEQRDYRPHVTLARRLRGFDGPCKLDPVTWRVRQFHLYRSAPAANGIRYQPIGSWPLA